MKQVQKQDVANQAFDQCGIEITSKAGTVYYFDAKTLFLLNFLFM